MQQERKTTMGPNEEEKSDDDKTNEPTPDDSDKDHGFGQESGGLGG